MSFLIYADMMMKHFKAPMMASNAIYVSLCLHRPIQNCLMVTLFSSLSACSSNQQLRSEDVIAHLMEALLNHLNQRTKHPASSRSVCFHTQQLLVKFLGRFGRWMRSHGARTAGQFDGLSCSSPNRRMVEPLKIFKETSAEMVTAELLSRSSKMAISRFFCLSDPVVDPVLL